MFFEGRTSAARREDDYQCEAQKLIDIAERSGGFPETGRFEGRPLTDESTLQNGRSWWRKPKAALEGSKLSRRIMRRWMFCYPCNAVIFYGLFEAMDGLPVIIRLIDPPLHEFLPSRRICWSMLPPCGLKAKRWFGRKEILLDAVNRLHESNPMMGLAASVWALSIRDIMRMRVRAIFEAASEAAQNFVVYPRS